MSADDNAPEQAREVVRWAVFDHSPYYNSGHLGCNCDCRPWEPNHVAEAVLTALAPIRAAERQEAARAAAERAWDEGQAVGYADGHSRNGNGRGFQAIGNPYRADGAAEQSVHPLHPLNLSRAARIYRTAGTTDHEQQETT